MEAKQARTGGFPLLLSIVIATRERHAAVARLLESLAATQDERLARVEVVLVEDGPSFLAGTVAWVGPVTRHRHPRRLGLAVARNEGIRLSRAPLIAFLDDDGVCSPRWLQALFDAFADPCCDAVGGVVAPADGGRNLYSALRDRVFYTETFGTGYRADGNRAVSPAKYASGGNSAYRREVFARHGAFDVLLPASIDIDLGVRLSRAGRRIVLSREMVLVHDHPRTLQGYLYRGFVSGQTKGILARRGEPRGPLLSANRSVLRGIRNVALWNVRRAARVSPRQYVAAWAVLQANDLAHLAGIASGFVKGRA